MKTPATVVHLITKLELGGAQINTLYTVEHLDPGRFRALLVSGPGGMLAPAEKKRPDWIVARRLARPIRPWRDAAALLELRGIFKKLRPQIVHTHSSKAGLLGRLAARSISVPVVVHSVHGFSFSPHQPWWQRIFFTAAERLVAPATSHFVFVAASDLAAAREKKLVGANASLIRSGFPVDRFRSRADAAELRRRFDIAAGDIVCGVVAPFKPQKGLFHLLEAAHRAIAREPRLLFFLAGDGGLRPELEARLSRLGIAGRFRLPGFGLEIDRWMDLFDIGVTTALWEGLPQSLVQMRLKKIPLVASDIPGNREVVREGANGFLVDFRDYDRFAERIALLARDPGLRRRLGDFSGEDFSDWDADLMVRKQEELYSRLLEEKKIRP